MARGGNTIDVEESSAPPISGGGVPSLNYFRRIDNDDRIPTTYSDNPINYNAFTNSAYVHDATNPKTPGLRNNSKIPESKDNDSNHQNIDSVKGSENGISHTDPQLGAGGKVPKIVRMRKDIGLLGGVAINVGVIIGSGIFVSPTTVLINAGSVGLSLIVWGLCGIFSFLGALCYAELGTTFPASGGEYAYIMAAFGNLPAFLYVWMCLLVLTTAGKAVNALAFSQYAIDPILAPYGTPPAITRLVAVCLISLLVFINCRKVQLATRIQTLFTTCKLLALLVIICVGIYEISKGNYRRFIPKKAFEGSNYKAGQIAVASYSGLYAYSGWNSLNYVTEEVKDSYK